MPPTVSIGIVTCNSEQDIQRCLAAVRRQTHPCDLLVVDNGSADSTRAIVERSTTPAERLFLDSNVGFSAAHNRAIDRTRGDFYLALNPDVVLRPDFVERLLVAVLPDSSTGAAT